MSRTRGTKTVHFKIIAITLVLGLLCPQTILAEELYERLQQSEEGLYLATIEERLPILFHMVFDLEPA